MILDKFKLDGKVALVTGGSKGLGRAIALGLAEAGADLAIASRSTEPSLQEAVEALGRRFFHQPADLSDRAQTKKVVPAVIDKLGRLDILVNNAGLNVRDEVLNFREVRLGPHPRKSS